MARYQFQKHESLPDTWVVANRDGLELGTLLRIQAERRAYRIYFGPGFVQSLGCCQTIDDGAQILGFYRRALLALDWFRISGQLDVLHEKFNGGRV